MEQKSGRDWRHSRTPLYSTQHPPLLCFPFPVQTQRVGAEGRVKVETGTLQGKDEGGTWPVTSRA